MPRIVQTQTLPRRLYLLGGHLQHGPLAQQHRQRIARRQRIERVNDHGDAEEDRDRDQDALDNVLCHCSFSPGGRTGSLHSPTLRKAGSAGSLHTSNIPDLPEEPQPVSAQNLLYVARTVAAIKQCPGQIRHFIGRLQAQWITQACPLAS